MMREERQREIGQEAREAIHNKRRGKFTNGITLNNDAVRHNR